MTPQWGNRWPWTAAIARLSRIRRLELIAAVVTAAVVLPFILTPGTAEGVEVTLEPASDAIVLGETFTLTAIIDIPVDQFVTSIEIDVEGPANFTVPVPLQSGPFDLSDAPGVSGQLTGNVAFPEDGSGYGYSFGYGYGYGDFEDESAFGYGYGYGFGDGFGSGYGYGYGDGAPGGPIVLTIHYTPVIAGTYTLRVRAITSMQDGPPIVTEAEVTFTVASLPPPPPPGSKVTLCHIPPGNPANAHLITVGAPAVKAHLRHGDVVTTACPSLAKGGKSFQTSAPGLETTLCDPVDGDSVPAVLITVGAPTVKIHKAKDKAKGNASAAACSSSDDAGQSLIPTVQGGKALLCHVSGNPAASHLILVPLGALEGHLAHGDLASGACPSSSNDAPYDGNEVEPATLPVLGGGKSSTPSAGGEGVGPSGKGKVGAKSPQGSGSSGKPTGQDEGEAKLSPPGDQKETRPTGPGKKAAGGKWKAKGRPSGNGNWKGNTSWLPPGLSKKVGDAEIGHGGKWKAKGPPPGKWKAKGPPPGKGVGAQPPGKKKGKKK